jgi:short-subunit dehydrogenase
MSTALITGASAGLGSDFAKLFAADKHDVVLVARRKDRLEALAAELVKEHRIKAYVIAVDLQRPTAVDEILASVSELGVEIDSLVNNAGYGDVALFADSDVEKLLGMLHVNISALTALTRAIVPQMIARGRGRILNIGSTAGFQPGPYMAVYYATKAYVNSFTEALACELDGTGVTATLSCPGATLTEFAAVAGNDKSKLFAMNAMKGDVVARQAYSAMHAGRRMIVHGIANKVQVFSVRLGPRPLVSAIAGWLNKSTSAMKQLSR